MLPSVSSLHVLKEISWRWSRRHLLSHHLRELGERRQGEWSLGLEKLREFVALEVRSAWQRSTAGGGISHLGQLFWGVPLVKDSKFCKLLSPSSLNPRDSLYFPVSYSLKEDVHLPSRVHRHPTSHLIICFMSCSLPALEEGGRKVGSGKGIVVRVPSMNNDRNY